MGVCIDLERYDYEKTKRNLLKVTKEKDEEMIDKILEEFGTKINNDYIVLNNEYYEEDNCAYNVLNFLESYYGFKDDEIWDCFVKSDKDMVVYKCIDTACENLGIDVEKFGEYKDE